jgi:hypothetical protein
MAKNWIFIISLSFIGCVSESSNHLDDLIPIDSLKSILIDIEKQQKLSFREPDSIRYMNQDSIILTSILSDYNFSLSTYEKTILFYIDRPQDMLKILHEVKDSLGS